MSSAISRAQPLGRKHLTMLGQKAKRTVDEVSENVSPLTMSILFVIPVVASALFSVWVHVATVRLGYELSAEARSHESLVEENRGIRVDIATLKSPERLKTLARESYRMGPPHPGQVIQLKRSIKK